MAERNLGPFAVWDERIVESSGPQAASVVEIDGEYYLLPNPQNDVAGQVVVIANQPYLELGAHDPSLPLVKTYVVGESALISIPIIPEEP